ncbi:ATP-binding protein [Paracoccus aminophilus]|nr:ATP-binding protein [Paracoccus aminophilus]
MTATRSRLSRRPMPRKQPMFHRIFPAEKIAIRTTLLELRGRFAAELAGDAIGRLELAVAEVLNNICEHGATEPLAERPTSAAPDRPHGRAPEGLVPPTVHLCVIQQNAGLACAITDNGVPLPAECFEPFGTPAFTTGLVALRSREAQTGALPEGGFGWFLIQDLTRAICYYREEQRNVLAFTIPLQEGATEDGAA